MRLFTCGLLLLLSSVAVAGTTVENVRIWSENDKTRVVLDLSHPVVHNIFTLRGPDRLVIDLKNSRLGKELEKMPRGAGAVRAVRSAVRANGQLRVVLDLNSAVRSRTFTAGPNVSYGDRLVIDLQQAGMQVSRELAKRINAEPGMKAVLVRDRDVYIDHRERTAIARRHKADLFVSVHADAVADRRARGASVYALSLKGASDEAARQLARRENASVGGVSLDDKDDVLASVLLDLSQNASLSASLDVGSRVAQEMGTVARMHRRTVQQAGFLVLKSPDLPSILVETAFLSNPDEEKKLLDSGYRGRLSNAILAGIRSYFYTNPPPDTQIAMNLRRQPARQVRHVVSRGDTVSQIAERYNVSSAEIRRANKLSSDNIRIGQTLSIPIFSGG
ncbi:MAG: N-acetylmuramoyl-L-alanine amidase [Woeseiaceae bacterium]